MTDPFKQPANTEYFYPHIRQDHPYLQTIVGGYEIAPVNTKQNFNSDYSIAELQIHTELMNPPEVKGGAKGGPPKKNETKKKK